MIKIEKRKRSKLIRQITFREMIRVPGRGDMLLIRFLKVSLEIHLSDEHSTRSSTYCRGIKYYSQ